MSERAQKIIFYFLFAALYYATNQPYVYAEAGIDPSWWTSLVMAIENNAVFGKDFIFNYGPLGYFNTLLLPAGVSPWLIFVFHTFLLFNYIFICKLVFEKLGKQWKWGGIIAILILLPWGFFADATFTLFYLLLFWLLYVRATRNTIPLFICILITVLIFYIKVNLSLIAMTVFLGSLLYFNIVKIVSWRSSAIIVVCFAIVTWLFSIGLNVAIPQYLGASLEIIDAYQDAMTVKLVDGAELWTMLGFFFVILLGVLLFITANLAYFWDNFFLYLLVSLACFLSFKQAFTATGHYNIFGFFLLLPPLLVLMFLFVKHKMGAWSGRMLVFVLVLQLMATQYIRLSYMNYDFKSYALFAFPDQVVGAYNANPKLYQLLKVAKYKNPFNYFADLIAYDYEENFKRKEVLESRSLPTEVLDKIGNATFDVVPWETSFAFFNKLNYSNRPVIQSYQANNAWLAGENGAKYFSKNAPEYVLANVISFREQNPYWIDKGVYQALRYNYKLVDTVYSQADTNYLFQNKSQLVQWEEKHFRTKRGVMNKVIPIPQDSLELYHFAEIEYNWKGKVARLFFQPPYLRCTVTYSDGASEDFRIPPPILKGGIFASQRVVDEKEFLSLYTTNVSTNKSLTSIKFWSDSEWGFKENFDFHFSQIKK